MKHLRSLATLASALLLASCSLTQQGEEGAAASSQARALTERPGNIFSTRSRSPKATSQQMADTETPPALAADSGTENTATIPVPTEEQQQAAASLLAQAPAEPPATTALPPVISEEDDSPTGFPFGGLRMGSIMPQEDPASATDAPPPGANTVERSGLRSPRLPVNLPMDINGRITSGN